MNKKSRYFSRFLDVTKASLSTICTCKDSGTQCFKFVQKKLCFLCLSASSRSHEGQSIRRCLCVWTLFSAWLEATEAKMWTKSKRYEKKRNLWTLFALQHILTFAKGLSFMPEFLLYKTCADSPPGFSPGCMNNVSVNIGEKAIFNCQVNSFILNFKCKN